MAHVDERLRLLITSRSADIAVAHSYHANSAIDALNVREICFGLSLGKPLVELIPVVAGWLRQNAN